MSARSRQCHGSKHRGLQPMGCTMGREEEISTALTVINFIALPGTQQQTTYDLLWSKQKTCEPSFNGMVGGPHRWSTGQREFKTYWRGFREKESREIFAPPLKSQGRAGRTRQGNGRLDVALLSRTFHPSLRDRVCGKNARS